MKYLAAALVTITILVADILGDLGMMSEKDATNWANWSGVTLFLFALLIIFGD